MSRVQRVFAALLAMLVLVVASGCGASEDDSRGAGPGRVIQHAKGKTKITGTPRRVVVLDTGELDAVLALGIKPVGTVVPDANGSLPRYLADRVGKVAKVGTIGQPKMEKIAALRPDLILSSKVRDEERYDELSKIAPTVFAETVGKTWKQNFLLDAKALGKQERARQILEDYQRRAAGTGQGLGAPSALKVSVLRLTQGKIRLYGRGSFIGTILEDVGLSRPENQRGDKTFTEVSRERLGDADSDRLFYSAYGENAGEQLNELVNSAQWKALRAAKTGKAVRVPDDTWLLGLGPIAAKLVLEDLGKYLNRK